MSGSPSVCIVLGALRLPILTVTGVGRDAAFFGQNFALPVGLLQVAASYLMRDC